MLIFIGIWIFQSRHFFDECPLVLDKPHGQPPAFFRQVPPPRNPELIYFLVQQPTLPFVLRETYFLHAVPQITHGVYVLPTVLNVFGEFSGMAVVIAKKWRCNPKQRHLATLADGFAEHLLQHVAARVFQLGHLQNLGDIF